MTEPIAGNESQKPQVFISHRHDDRELANVIREFIRSTTAGAVDVYQTTYEGSGPEFGRVLSKELGEELDRSEVVLLLYTVPDENWSYCMWECGVAYNPRREDTRIIVMQCGMDAPAPLSDSVRVRLDDENSVTRFVRDFATSEEFFPRLKRPITKFSEESEEIRDAASKLFEQLTPFRVEQRDEEWPAWPYIRFSIGCEDVDRIKKHWSDDKHKEARRLLLERCYICNGETDADSYAKQLIGTRKFEKNTSLDQVIKDWVSKTTTKETGWADSLVEQLLLGLRWEFPKDSWSLMQHSQQPSLYAPMLMRVGISRQKQCMWFDVYFVRFPVKKGVVTMNLGAAQKQKDKN